MRLSRKRKKQLARSVRRWMPRGWRCPKALWRVLWRSAVDLRRPLRWSDLDFGAGDDRTVYTLWRYDMMPPRPLLLSMVTV